MTSPSVPSRARRRALGRCSALAIAGAVIVSSPMPTAAAHVGVSALETAAGVSTVASFTVGHGCAGAPTTAVSITLPPEVSGVSPVRNPGWDVDVVREAADDGADGHAATGRVVSVTFTADEPLADGVRDTFELALTLPEQPETDLVFPTVQSCTKGETAWTQVAASGQDPHDLEAPAPVLRTTAARPAPAAHPAGGHGASADGAGEDGAGGNGASDDGASADGDGAASTSEADESLWGPIGAGLGGLALLVGLVALRRSRRA